MIREAIILAGGLGTRLRDTLPDLPKCMAPVAGRPFLFYVINHLRGQGIERIIFSLGYKHEIIEAWLEKEFSTLDYTCSVEDEPLGTGGAILLACSKVEDEHVVVVNGDTLFDADLRAAAHFHEHAMSECTLLLKPMNDFERYGVVETDGDGLVQHFKEKQFYKTGNINGGTYILNRYKFLDEEFPLRFSFEKDYLEALFSQRRIYGFVQDNYFIDIGIPEDFQRAQTELARLVPDLRNIDKDWTLLIDRDGIINYEKKEDYIRNWDEFRFYDDALPAFRKFNERFGKIIVVSNQRGVGKGLMTENDLKEINENMKKAIEDAGGRIDGIYYCTSTNNKHPERKPNPGMAHRAKQDFPEIDLGKTIMVGNKMSDMGFGKNAGVYTVFIASTNPESPFPHPNIDFRFASLNDFIKAF